MAKIAITGASGLIGKQAVEFFCAAGHVVYPVRRGKGNRNEATWDTQSGEIAFPEPVDVLLHLAGRSVAARWTAKVRREIWDSRIPATEKLCLFLAGMTPKARPKLLVSASAVGIYGNRGDEILAEDSAFAPPKKSFLADVCRAWEAATKPAEEAGIRVIHVRLGVVLSKHGGALATLLTPTKLCLGGPVGNGMQWMPWISRSDTVRLLAHLATSQSFSGVVNAVAGDVRQHEFMRTLGRIVHRPTIFPLPGFMVKLIFGEMGREVLLGSQRVMATRLPEGFQFEHTNLEAAMRAELSKPAKIKKDTIK